MFAYINKKYYFCTEFETLSSVMKRELLPKYERQLRTVGENIRLARLRRDLTTTQIAERAGIGRNAVGKIEKGDEGVSIGAYLRVLIVLGLERDLFRIAEADILGRKLQDAGLQIGKRASKKSHE